MREPEVLDFSPKNLAVETIEQFYFTVDPERKFDLLVKLLEREDPEQAIIFCRTKRGTDKIYTRLARRFQHVDTIHGDLQQSSRDRVMKGFREGKVRWLVATDVVGRGIDVTGISHIINFDIPQFCDDYVHRVGRTGRMGREGVAYTFVTPEEGGELTRIEMRINRLLKRDEVPGFQAFDDTPPASGYPADGVVLSEVPAWTTILWNLSSRPRCRSSASGRGGSAGRCDAPDWQAGTVRRGYGVLPARNCALLVPAYAVVNITASSSNSSSACKGTRAQSGRLFSSQPSSWNDFSSRYTSKRSCTFSGSCGTNAWPLLTARYDFKNAAPAQADQNRIQSQPRRFLGREDHAAGPVRQGRVADVIEGAQHAGHVAQRRRPELALADRARRVALEIDDHEVAAGIEDLAQVEIAVAADPRGVDLAFDDPPKPLEELGFARHDGLGLRPGLPRAPAADCGGAG